MPTVSEEMQKREGEKQQERQVVKKPGQVCLVFHNQKIDGDGEKGQKYPARARAPERFGSMRVLVIHGALLVDSFDELPTRTSARCSVTEKGGDRGKGQQRQARFRIPPRT